MCRARVQFCEHWNCQHLRGRAPQKSLVAARWIQPTLPPVPDEQFKKLRVDSVRSAIVSQWCRFSHDHPGIATYRLDW
ncbi:hypothetical protein [Gimesia sp.]|uniref:hypothetical protein n=1 Tax=Gimesia sp. TaxID=2024833 RepID=UPI0025C54C2C|nr:hypothetical protein [Gimesia sp.]